MGQEFSKLGGQATTLIIDYEGDLDRELERQTVEALTPAIHPKGCRVVTYCNADPPVPEPGEPTVSRLLFDRSSGAPSGISLNAYMSYLHAKDKKGLQYPLEKIGYWVTTIRGRRVMVVVCLD